ncbi:ATP-binding protein [Empedobacter falsenii]
MNLATKHKKYKILKFENSYCEVQDIATNQFHKCFSLDEHKVGDIVYLFNAGINIHTGNPFFKYSILNTYEVGKDYDFEIVSEIDNNLTIEDEFRNQFRVPKLFKEFNNQDYITLKIEKLELEKNKLKFISKNKSNDNKDFSIFEFNNVYSLKIDTITSSNNGLNFANSLYKGNKYSFLIPQSIKDLKIGDSVDVNLYRNREGETKLNFTRRFIATKLYTIGQKYSFEIEQIAINSFNDLEVWKLVDPFTNFKQDYYPSYDKSFANEKQEYSTGDTIELIVTNITDKGILHLTTKPTNNYERTQYVIEDIFDKLLIKNYLQEYFYDLEEFIDENDENNFIEQYKSGSNLWLFSYFTLLDKLIYLELEDGEFIQVNTIIDIYTKLEKWMLLSGYMNNFSADKKSDILKKSKQKSEKLIALKSAVDLYLESKNEEYITELDQQLNNTPVLLDDQKATLIELFRISHLINTDDYNLDTLHTLNKFLNVGIGIYDDDDIFKITSALETKIISYKEEIVECINNEDDSNRERLFFFISNLYLYQFFVIKNNDYEKITYNSFNLLKLCAILFKEFNKEYNELIVELIIKNKYIHVAEVSEELGNNLTPNFFKSIANSLPSNADYINSGKAFRQNDFITIIPGNHFNQNVNSANQLISLDKFNLNIASNIDKNKINKDSTTDELINEVLKIHNFKNKKQFLENQDFNIETTYKATVKGIDRDKRFVYVNTVINEKLIEFTLHINYFDKFNWINDISKILFKGDVLSFNITYVEENKVFIKFTEQFQDKINDFIEMDVIQIIKIIKTDDKGALGITESGKIVVINETNLIVNKFYEIKLIDYNDSLKAFIGDNYKLINYSFKMSPERLFRTFLIEYNFVEPTDLFQFNRIFDTQLKFLMTSIEATISDQDDLKDTIINFFFLYTISSFLRNGKSYYYKQKLNNIYNILHINSGQENLELIDIDETAISRFENLKTDRAVYDLLKYFNTDTIDIPVQINVENKYYKAKKLIESYNLIKQYNQNQDLFKYYKQLIISELLNNEKMIERDLEIDGLIRLNEKENQLLIRHKTNLGLESKFQEFKSSFFYSASETKQVDIILRTINGFLNSFEGGSLFIGVNDDGDIIGLDNDLNFDNKKRSLDQYKNEIVSAINYGFPKEIASLFIDIKFHMVNHLTYLEIEIKSYDSPIHYKNEFWLRQANRTTILKGNDLTDFFARKMSVKASNSSDFLKNSKSSSDEILYGDEIVYKEDFYSEFKKEGEISNSLFSNNVDDYIVTLYIYSDNAYLISKDENKVGYLFKVTITENDKLNYLLMCYDNACVNKVDIRQIISKKLNKRYSNAMSDYGKLIATFIAKDSDHILIQTTCSKREHVKIIHSNKITAHRSLGLKGNQIVQEEIDAVNKYLIVNNELANRYPNFVRESKQGYGIALNTNNSKTLEKIIKYLE